MAKHVHKWRRLTKADGPWGCYGGPECAEKAVWCCVDSFPYECGKSCVHGRCANHGPKPKRRKAKVFARWQLEMRGIRRHALVVTFDGRVVPKATIVSALNATRVVLPKARGDKR